MWKIYFLPEMIASKLGISVEAITALLQSVEEALSSPHLVKKLSGLGKLSLNVAHLCNLRCSYCYAQHGDYGLGHQLMPAQVARAAIDMAFEKFGRIHTIQFFGGEPLLNLPVITTVCEYVTNLTRTKGIPAPSFGLITNLTIFPKRLEEVVNRFKLHITVSLDGPKEINDLHQVFPNGKGTYDVISANIKRLKEHTGQPIAIEATITKDHAKLGYTKDRLLEFFFNEFGIKSFIIGAVWERGGEELFGPCPSWWADETKKELTHGVSEKGLVDVEELQDMIPLIVKAQSHLWCGAGISILTITPTGDIFPCHLFLYHPEFKIGNVMDRSWDDPVVIRLQENSKVSTPKCRKCEAKWLCRACIAGTLDILGTINPSCSEKFCKYIQGRAARVLNEFVKLHSNAEIRRHVVAAIKSCLPRAD